MNTNLSSTFSTHEVFNQPPPLQDFNAYLGDAALTEAVIREGGSWGNVSLEAFGKLIADEMMALGSDANASDPTLQTFDRYGHRIDEVVYHPSYHRLMTLGAQHGVHSFAWNHEDRPGAHVVRGALQFLHSQADQGTVCPLTMTYACIPVLRSSPSLAKEWLPRVKALDYDPRCLPAKEKIASQVGMGMTEKQGGSDVRANTSHAQSIGGDEYSIVGHKWFFSAPMSDAFLVLAQANDGLTCFLMPRWCPDGTRNAIRLQRLKNKLGNRSNASSEVEFQGAYATRVGPEGRGVATILEMVSLTRLDCMLGSAAIMRQALTQAIHHTRNRNAFGRKLSDHALMQNVLADLALESEAATAFSMRVARAVDSSATNVMEAAFARIATAIGKYYICKRTPIMVAEALECLGGAGYIEESIMPRLYRDAPLNSIWEGCANIQCLDVLRAMAKTPEVLDVVLAELQTSRSCHSGLAREVEWLSKTLGDKDSIESRSRIVVERLALALQATTLFKSQNTLVAELFCRSRFGDDRGMCFGTLPEPTLHAQIVNRASIQK